MSYDRRFVRASITEILTNVWILTVTYSYYGLYDFTESHTLDSLDAAKDRLLYIRTDSDRLRITDVNQLNIVLG